MSTNEQYSQGTVYADLAGKTAVVTGAGSCIGRAIAYELGMRQKMFVAVLDIMEASGRETEETIKRNGGSAQFYSCDVKDEGNVRAIFDNLRQGRTVETVVNNAGIALKESMPIARLDVAQFRKLLDVNVIGYALVSKYAAQAFIEQAGDHHFLDGSLIYICSNSGIVGSANNPYGVTNGARLTLMREMAAELGSMGVRSNAVAPGNVVQGSGLWAGGYLDSRAATKKMTAEAATAAYEHRGLLPMIQATPEQVAEIVAVLASPNGPFKRTTSKVFSADGGELQFP
ncbi:MAG TPA: SDR family oxidoreductase [Candidatus Nanoarchaeia archaeon]|nr:SDR family oxidoreductase [Candidatus Nanoarchaeia archaeon]